MVKSLHNTFKEFINSEYFWKRFENYFLTLFLDFYLPHLDQQTFLDLKFLTFNVQPKQGVGLYAGRLIREYVR